MIWILCAAIIGLMIGYISHAFQNVFLALLIITLPIAAILYFRVFLPLAVATSGLGLEGHDPITLTIELMELLPQSIQSAIIIFLIAAFSGRLFTWLHSKLTYEPPVEETKLDRKKRILERYKSNDSLPS